MKFSIKTNLLVWYIAYVVMACVPEQKKKVKIDLKGLSQRHSEIRLNFLSNLTWRNLLDSAQTDSNGSASIELELREPIMATLQIGERYVELYLSPGDNLQLEENDQTTHRQFRFSGQGSEINHYFSWVNATVQVIRFSGGGMPSWTKKQYQRTADSLQVLIRNYFQNYSDSLDLSSEARSVIDEKNNIKLLAFASEYTYLGLNNIMNEKFQAKQAGREHLSTKLSTEIDATLQNIPFEAKFLSNGSGDYANLLNYYWLAKVNLKVYETVLESGDSSKFAPLMSDHLIIGANLPEPIREYLRAHNLNYHLKTDGITDQTQRVYNNYNKSYPQSIYLPSIQKEYDEWMAIAPGNRAPPFEGFTIEGKKVSINDLKGKVVYIDVWATWCSPCLAEIPHAIKLQQEFETESDMEFLNVAVDYNETNWKKYLGQEKRWNGMHLIIRQKELQSFYSAYKLSGIPAYILIDRSGSIVSIKASHPSNEKVRSEIAGALSKPAPAP